MKRKKILIVEDEVIIAQEEKELVENLGYEVIGISVSGEDAIERTSKEKPDLVIMDRNLMGKMDGVEAAWKIRAVHDVPVIFITATGDKKIFDNALGKKCVGYIIKPFTRDELQQNIEWALSENRKNI